VLYAPLLDRGIPLRELAGYTRLELVVWLKILERHNLLKNGAQLEEMSSHGTIQGRDVDLMNRYLEEREKLAHLAGEDPAPAGFS
jgi:hypothetical protein